MMTDTKMREALAEHAQTFEIGPVASVGDVAGAAGRRTTRNRIIASAGALVMVVALAIGVGNIGQPTEAGLIVADNPTDLPRIVAEPAFIRSTFEGLPGGLSPSGELLVVEGTSETCLVETANRSERFCLDSSILASWWDPIWSPDSNFVVVASPINNDIVLIDAATGTLTNLTDDGVFDLNNDPPSTEVPRDTSPTFSPSGNRILFSRNDGETLGLRLYDLSSREIIGGFDWNADADIVFDVMNHSPLMVDESRALASAKNSIYEINLETGETVKLFDFTDSFAPETDGLGFDSAPFLYPTGHFDDGRVLLADPNQSRAFNQSWAERGFSSGYYVADPSDGSLTPLFQTGPGSDGWFGPVSAIRAADNQLVVAWLDTSTGGVTRQDGEHIPFTYQLSLLDLAAVDLPVLPSELTNLWHSGDLGVGVFSYETSTPARVSDEGTLAIIVEKEAWLLELATE